MLPFKNIAKVDDAVKMRLRIDRADVFVRMIREIRHSRSRKQREAEIVRLPECMELFLSATGNCPQKCGSIWMPPSIFNNERFCLASAEAF